MPIIVDEVVISVEVTNQTSDKTSSSGGENQTIIHECVEQVLDILRQKMER